MKTSPVCCRVAVGFLAEAILFVLVAFTPSGFVPAGTAEPAKSGNYTLSGPYIHENVTVFLIHGKDQQKTTDFLTFAEAMETKKVVVQETGNVSELTLENISPDRHLFVQSGETVKGGNQDRLIACDFLVSPASGKLPLASFCVEQGRWARRGREPVGQFSKSTGQLPSKGLRLAGGNLGQQGGFGGGGFGGGGFCGGGLGFGGGGFGGLGFQGGGQLGMQGGVWMEVDSVQMKLEKKLGVPVEAKGAGASLVLTLEHPKVKDALMKYVERLASCVNGKPDAVGYVFVLNGRINCADVYGSRTLFRKVWPRLLEANAVEGVAEMDKGKKFPPVAVQEVLAFLEELDKGKPMEVEVNPRTRIITKETPKAFYSETQDKMRKEWVHRSYQMK